jgi:3-oxoacyl-[acyl-carrier-protein] synthase II
MKNEIWITGCGLVSPLGGTEDECWARLESGASTATRHPRYGYAHHPVVGFDPAAFVQRRADIRQMGDLMLYSTAAATKALKHADLAPGSAAIEKLQICIAADGGERDVAADEVAIKAALGAADPAPALNEQLMNARPSHFLTQLPNLIPSNICIVNGVSAPSRTLMGTEATSVEALRDAVSRIDAGQGDLFLVGSSRNSDDIGGALALAADGRMSHDPIENVWAETNGGFSVAGGGAFLVVESATHAKGRGARPLARITAVEQSFAPRDGTTTAERRLLARWQHAVKSAPASLGVISGISGQGEHARRERNFLGGIQAAGTRVSARAPARVQGHAVEAAFFTNVILAVMCLGRRRLFATLEPSEPLERVALEGALDRVLVTSWGSTSAEGFAQLEAA